MFGMEKWMGKKQREATPEDENVVNIAEAQAAPAAAPEAPGIIARDALGNPVGSASSPAEARAKEIQANIDAREAA